MILNFMMSNWQEGLVYRQTCYHDKIVQTFLSMSYTNNTFFEGGGAFSFFCVCVNYRVITVERIHLCLTLERGSSLASKLLIYHFLQTLSILKHYNE